MRMFPCAKRLGHSASMAARTSGAAFATTTKRTPTCVAMPRRSSGRASSLKKRLMS